jgi:hypothetical protein
MMFSSTRRTPAMFRGSALEPDRELVHRRQSERYVSRTTPIADVRPDEQIVGDVPGAAIHAAAGQLGSTLTVHRA